MAPKRAAESEAEEGSTPPKRARRVENGAKSKRKQPANGRRESSSEEPSDTESDRSTPSRRNGHNNVRESEVEHLDAEAEFERLNADMVVNSINKRKSGSAAEAGIISSVEVHNFMCHKYVTFKFGPQVNFIIGNNGSGKSAALSAIIVALGGKATSTGRASAGLKSFIKSGENAAEVSVTIKNGGNEPYRPDAYGNAITVTRAFTQAGSSSYKLKNTQGRTVSTSRTELSAILDHYQIDVDNPMNILTQDLARQFLSSSNPGEKYNLFLKGTLLTQLSEEYTLILDNCSKTMAILEQKGIAVAELRARLEELRERHRRARTLAESENAIAEIKREMAWAHIAEKEEEVSQAIMDTATAKELGDDATNKVATGERELAEAEAAVNAAEVQMAQAASPQELVEQKEDVDQRVRTEKEDLRSAKRDAREMATAIRDAKDKLAESEAKIAEARQKLDQDVRREGIRRQIEEAQRVHNEDKERHNAAVVEKNRATEALDAHKSDLSTTERQFEDLRRRIADAEQQVNHWKNIMSDKGGAAAYGQAVPELMKEIAKARWRGRSPLGPLGLHVKLKDQKWAYALRVGLGNVLGSFVVTDYQDQRTLRKMLADRGMHRTGVIYSQPDMFDYRAGEAPEPLLTVLRVLEIQDEWVVRILINSNQVEKTVLANTRLEAEDILRSHPRYNVWTANGLRVQRFQDGGGSTTSLGQIRSAQDFRAFLFADNRKEAEYEKATAEFEKLRPEYQRLEGLKVTAEREVNNAKEQLNQALRRERQAETTARRSHQALLAAKAEDVQEIPLDLQAEEEIAEGYRSEVRDTERQLAEVVQRIEKIDANLRPLVHQTNELRRALEDHAGKRREIKLQVEAAVGAHTRARHQLDYYLARKAEQDLKIAKAKEKQNTLEKEYTKWRTDVLARFDEHPHPRKREVLEKLLKAKEQAYARSIQEQGKTFEEIEADLEQANEIYQKAKQEFDELNGLVRLLRKSLQTRMTKWQSFRRFISLRCKLSFQFYLSQRGFYGQMKLDHKEKTLALAVQTDDQTNKNGKAKEKDAKSMSGGEKSFSTICLLLSLWDAMNCPVRALDEFDVYMDAVNRRISMKMMLDVAKNSDKQHILITPQEMGSIQFGPEVRIHRMRDPERGQQTLAF